MSACNMIRDDHTSKINLISLPFLSVVQFVLIALDTEIKRRTENLSNCKWSFSKENFSKWSWLWITFLPLMVVRLLSTWFSISCKSPIEHDSKFSPNSFLDFFLFLQVDKLISSGKTIKKKKKLKSMTPSVWFQKFNLLCHICNFNLPLLHINAPSSISQQIKLSYFKANCVVDATLSF